MKNLKILFFLIGFLAICEAKSLILIIASNDHPVYTIHEKSWERYMNSFPDEFECYFIKEDKNLDCEAKIEGNNLWIKNEMSYIPGILEKTVYAFKFFENKLNEYEYIIRTNLSSFYYFPALKALLDSFPKKNLYAGCINTRPYPKFPNYVSGAGIYMSPDVCRLISQKSDEILKLKYQEIDDVILGKFLNMEGIYPTSSSRFDITKSQELKYFEMLSKKNKHLRIFHVRTKCLNESQRLTWESYVTEFLYKCFYIKTAYLTSVETHIMQDKNKKR